MKRRCTCGLSYDDAERSTLCPHEEILTHAEREQKDLAISLLGRDLHWAHLPDGPIVRIQSITWNGMVTLHDWTGEFAPHCFVP